MNYNKLHYFYEIAKAKNISHTAERLFISQSSLSKAVADLEKDFDTKLFIRTNRNLILTEAGRELFRRIEPLFSAEDELFSAVYETGHKEKEAALSLHIGFMFFDATCRLPENATRFSKEHPNISVHLSRINKAQLLSALKKEQLDAVLVIFTMDEVSPEFNYKIFGEHHISVIMRKDHPLASRRSISLTELKNEEFIMHGSHSSTLEYDYVLSFCHRNHLDPKITASFDYVETVLMMVQSGMGITFLSDAAPLSDLDNLISVPIDNAPVLYSGILYKEPQFSPTLELFYSFFLSTLKQ